MPRPTPILGLPRPATPFSGRHAAASLLPRQKPLVRTLRGLRGLHACPRRRPLFVFMLPLLCLVGVAMLSACQSAAPHFRPQSNQDYSRGMAHLVRPGDTLSSIAFYYRRDVALLARLNDLSAPYLIRANTHLYIPPSNTYQILQHHPRMMEQIRAFRKRCDGHLSPSSTPTRKYAKTGKFPAPKLSTPKKSIPLPRKTASSSKTHLASSLPRKATPKKTSSVKAAPAKAPPRSAKFSCDLPLKKFTYMRGFSASSWLNPHKGVDLAADSGSTIYAAASGTVLFSDKFGGLGNMVSIDHGKGFSTVYGHASVNLVKKGAHVRQGQAIARVGSTGLSTGPHLHFEVRYNGTAIDPENYLPPLENKKRTASR